MAFDLQKPIQPSTPHQPTLFGNVTIRTLTRRRSFKIVDAKMLKELSLLNHVLTRKND